jgi:hypothetical protein
VALLGIMVIIVTLIPGIIYLLQSPKLKTMPFFPLIGGFYLFFFGLPIFLIPFGYIENGAIIMYDRIILPEVKSEIIALVLGGLLMQLVAFYGLQAIAGKRLPKYNLSGLWLSKNATLFVLYLGLFAGHALNALIEDIARLPSIGQFLDPAGLIAISGIILQFQEKSLNKYQTGLFFLIIIPLELVILFQDLLLGNKVLMVLLILILSIRVSQIKPIIFIGLLFMIIIPSYSLTSSIRTSFETPLTKIDRFIEEAAIKYDKGLLFYSQRKAASTIIHRFSQIWVFHHVYEQTPEPIPYWGGKTYSPLVTSFIPRAIYPEKPTEKLGNDFGKRYNFLLDDNTRTSLNTPWITELLANFGRWGVLFGMFFVGILLAFLDKFFNSQRTSNLEFAVGIGILLPLVRVESNFSVMVGSILPLTICLFCYFKCGAWLLGKLPFTAFRSNSIPSFKRGG